MRCVVALLGAQAQVLEQSIKAMDLLIMSISRGFHPNYGNNSEAKLMKNPKKIIFSSFCLNFTGSINFLVSVCDWPLTSSTALSVNYC